MKHLLAIVLIIVFVIIAAYVFLQYKPSGLTFKNIFSGLRASTSTNPFWGGNTYNRPPPPSGTYITSPQQPQVNPSDIPSGFTVKNISPYFKKVSVSASPASFGSYGQVLLYSYFSQGERVNVTGWLLKGNRGSMYIPQAVAVYDPAGFAENSDINLMNGDTLYIYSSYSPISRNLRLNKCMGYLSNINTFVPPLPSNCPYVNRSDIANFTSPCQSYILSLGSCQSSRSNPPVPDNDVACRQFLDKLNYAGCFSKYNSDSDFLSHEWRVWAGAPFWDTQHDQIFLFDRDGLLVNKYSY